jgi:predicted MarR family transcription regulator
MPPSRGQGRAGAGPAQDLRILSSAHLAGDDSAELSELEFGLIVAGNAFGRWVIRCMAAAGVPDLTLTDALVLHHVHHRGRPKKLADVCFTLNYEDSHVVNYALKKLVGMGLLRGDKQGKEVFYSTTADGVALVVRYAEVRERCLLPAALREDADRAELARIAQRLRELSGIYDQAARAAASL